MSIIIIKNKYYHEERWKIRKFMHNLQIHILSFSVQGEELIYLIPFVFFCLYSQIVFIFPLRLLK
jgi:hypothetical protein